MKVVLLAAGRSFRMAPIRDKNFLQFLGKPLLLHQIKAFQNAGFKEILVIGGKHNIAVLRKVCAGIDGVKVSVREQKNLELGMAGAVLAAAPWVKAEPFLLVSGNDIVDPEAFSVIAKQSGKSCGLLLARKVSSYFPGGYLKTNPKGLITHIIEKPKPGREPSRMVNIVVHCHPDSRVLFNALKDAIASASAKRAGDDLYECALQQLFNKKIPYRALPYVGFWQSVKYPWHILALSAHYLSRLSRTGGKKAQIAKIAESAIIKGDVYLEEGVQVLDNAVIQGPAYVGKNTIIATNAFVRESHIGADCVIGFGSEIARSYLGNQVRTHTNYIGDSVIGNDVSFGAGTITGNLRLDEKPIFAAVTKTWNGVTEETRVNTERIKLGLITGDHIRVGINASFMPGVKIGSGSFVGAGIVVSEDVAEGSFVRGEWKLKVSPNMSSPLCRRGGKL